MDRHFRAFVLRPVTKARERFSIHLSSGRFTYEVEIGFRRRRVGRTIAQANVAGRITALLKWPVVFADRTGEEDNCFASLFNRAQIQRPKDMVTIGSNIDIKFGFNDTKSVRHTTREV